MLKKLFIVLMIATFITGCNLLDTEKNIQTLEKSKIDNSNSHIKETEDKKQSNSNATYPKIDAVVVDVIDGDTIKVSLGKKIEKVRFLLVDTPETRHPKKGVQPFGPEASDFTKKHIKIGDTVQLEKDVSERDKFGRLLAYVYVNGEMINEMLLKEGLARVAYVYVPNTRYIDKFKELQDKSRQKKLGIWSIENYEDSKSRK
ncbi:thermonuclease family protein [Bacillus sp. Brlt_9]|uniref:thermonuclease family protein n=1 Tax=Bacillus sp. Brlt_9 TaxID=3110916 RepID=UPI003F7C42B6